MMLLSANETDCTLLDDSSRNAKEAMVAPVASRAARVPDLRVSPIAAMPSPASRAVNRAELSDAEMLSEENEALRVEGPGVMAHPFTERKLIWMRCHSRVFSKLPAPG